MIKDIDELIMILDDDTKDHEVPIVLNDTERDLLIDALVFYKEMNTH